MGPTCNLSNQTSRRPATGLLLELTTQQGSTKGLQRETQVNSSRDDFSWIPDGNKKSFLLWTGSVLTHHATLLRACVFPSCILAWGWAGGGGGGGDDDTDGLPSLRHEVTQEQHG